MGVAMFYFLFRNRYKLGTEVVKEKFSSMYYWGGGVRIRKLGIV
jgi:hypothetical protein